MATDHPSVQKLASVVKVVRDRLRKVGITDMDSMMHNVLFVAARMLDDATIKKLGIPPPLLWINLIKKVNDKDNEGADKQFKNILDILDSKFGMKRFPYMLESTEDFVSIMKAYNEVDIHEATKHTDVLGYIYEQHLSTGSGSGRDLGKFYTDRKITRYLTELLDVDVSTLGRPDSMCDATMGTGGFILSYIDLVHEKRPDIKWDLMDLAGGDIDDKVAAIARLNVFLRTGKIFPMIRQRNTLKNDICDPAQISERRTFNRLLMNIPFGVKGLTLADDCCPRVKEIVKAGTKSEPLFMALVCQLLAEGGKAAVIVPDGFIENCSNQHYTMRKYMLDNFKVLRIIKMRGKFFMNTGIQPSVIVFERSGKTEEVEFWDVEKKDSGELIESCILKLARDKFDNSCSFALRNYQEVKATNAKSDCIIVKLGELYNQPAKVNKFNAGDMDNTGTIPFYSAKWNSPTGTHSLASYKSENPYFVVIKSGGGDHTSNKVGLGMFFDVSGEIAASVHVLLLEKNKEVKYEFLHRYVHYYMKYKIKDLRDKAKKSVNLEVLSLDSILGFNIVLPPLPIQQEIVQALDLIYTNAAAAKATATSIKAQMAAVMRSVGVRGFEKKKLGDLCDLLSGKGGNYQEDGNTYPYYDSNGITGYRKDFCFEGEHIITARKMSIGAVHFASGKFWSSDNTINIRIKDATVLSTRFFYLWLLLNNRALKDLSSGIKPGIRKSEVAEILMPLPPLPIQQEVLAILNEMEAELKVMEQMAEKAEQRAKYILDGYLTS